MNIQYIQELQEKAKQEKQVLFRDLQYDSIEDYKTSKTRVLKQEKSSSPINHILKNVNISNKGNKKNKKEYFLPKWYQQCEMNFDDAKKEEEYRKIIMK